MSYQEITSLHSPHVGRVKALLGSRSKKIRDEDGLFIAEGIQSVRSALQTSQSKIVALYLSHDGHTRLLEDSPDLRLPDETYLVSDVVMQEMAQTQTPQGIVALCAIPKLQRQLSEYSRIAFFWQMQDPGNAGTVIRTADAFGFDAVVFSENSVDVYAPKVVRSTAGSLWNIDIFQDIPLDSLFDPNFTFHVILAFAGEGREELSEIAKRYMQQREGKKDSEEKIVLIFGNEARGLPDLDSLVNRGARSVHIEMSGRAESLNVASAASIAMYAMRAH